MSVHHLTELIGRKVGVHHAALVVVEQVDGADAVVQRQAAETVDGGMALLVQVVNLQPEVQLDAPGILLLEAAELGSAR